MAKRPENRSYATRKDQIETEFVRELKRILKQEGIGYFNRRQDAAIKKALRDAAMVGAAEERHRILQMQSLNSGIRNAISERSILSVLGYE